VEQSQKQQIITIITYYIMNFLYFKNIKICHNHDMFQPDQTIIQWTEINTEDHIIALILQIQIFLPANI
jgi:hypothetical protein